MAVVRFLARLAFPQRCASCRTASFGALCEACAGTVRWLADPVCPSCGAPGTDELCGACARRPPAFRRARAAAAYDGAARDAVLRLKLSGERRDAAWLGRAMAECSGALDGEAVCFVPAAPRDLRRRGFNQAEALAAAFAEARGLRLVRPLAKREATADQAGLGRDARARNLAGAFVPVRAAPRAVILVDDIITTGATADACARALLRAGARTVDVLAFARTGWAEPPPKLADRPFRSRPGAY